MPTLSIPATVRPARRAGLVALALALALVTPAIAETVQIVALGDSNTYGFGIDRDKTYPAQLEAVLRNRGHDVAIVNAGVNGDMTFETIARLEQSIPAGTDGVIVFLGRNDWRKGVSAVTISRNLDVIVGALRGAGMDVLLVGFAPNDFSAVAEKHGALYYENFFDGVTRFGRKMRRYKLGDLGGHLNPDGYAVIVERLTPTVEALLDRINSGAE
ncbi:GDSL-type esterase/lipase family protein [Bauldia sp.]|uniref:GDSL-type esterase/lipase family protein n=1 Tax=Bauldia sp. TaxID=2575872 RepID=UPI003BABD997